MKEIIISDGKSWFKRGHSVELKITESISKNILIVSYFDQQLNKFEIIEFLKSTHGEPKLYIASTYLMRKEQTLKILRELDV